MSIDPTVSGALVGGAHDGAVLAMMQFDPDTGWITGHRLVDPDAPQLSVMDLAATRGDGVFETISVGRGRGQALETHLRRLQHSAALLELPDQDLDRWRDAVVELAGLLAHHEEAFVKIVLTRGVEGGRVPTGWAWGQPSPDHRAAREQGIRVVLLDRGYRHDVAQTSPWLLAGAKSLSYAVNKAAFREAARRGADDALFVSSDGSLLEGAVSNLVLRLRDGSGERLVTPRTDLGILSGTTQADIFRWADAHGLRTGFEVLTVDDLASAEAAWLVSSVRHAAPVREVDGVGMPVDAEFTRQLNEFLRGRRE